MEMKFSPKAVIYDMDGVLIDSEPFWKKAEIAAFKEVGIKLTAQDCEQTVGMRIDEVVAFWYNRQPWDNKSQNEVVDHIMDLMCHYIEKEGEPLEGVKESLEFFKNKGVKIALATSSYVVLLDAVLKKLQIDHYFEYTRSAQLEEYGKPHPAVYINTANAINVDPKDCLVIEDSEPGVMAAIKGGFEVYVLTNEKKKATFEKLGAKVFYEMKELGALLGID